MIQPPVKREPLFRERCCSCEVTTRSARWRCSRVTPDLAGQGAAKCALTRYDVSLSTPICESLPFRVYPDQGFCRRSRSNPALIVAGSECVELE